MSRTLIIVAHGSSVNPASALSVVEQTARLAARPEVRTRFDRVEARFLKQHPYLSDFEPRDDELVVVPFFMAEGYFVRQVLPRQLPRSARISPALGSARLDDIVQASVQRFASDPHVVLVGHGTERSDTSAASLRELAGRLKPTARSVRCAFVDQDPRLAGTLDSIADDGAPIVVVPYFAFAGPHTEVDIPEGLGMPDAGAGPHHIGGRVVHYAPPVGAEPAIVDVLAALALPQT